MTHYYNEIDPYCCQWLQNLMDAGHIPVGVIDSRSIEDVRPDELRGFVQCHFFAGIGGWSLAARLAGWPDDRPLWTGSAPCQPFSVAGKGAGASDERHLWPHYFRLIRACRPDAVMGEQVAAAVGKDWLDGVFADLEGIGYAFGAAVVPACAVNAPHRRDRLWFVAGSRVLADVHGERGEAGISGPDTRQEGFAGIADDYSGPRSTLCDADQLGASTERTERSGQLGGVGGDPQGGVGELADSHGVTSGQGCALINGSDAGSHTVARSRSSGDGGIWHNAAWIIGHDGKARRVGTSFRRMVDGFSAGMGGLRPDLHAETIQEVIRYGQETFTGSAKVLRALWLCVCAQPTAYGQVGKQTGICGAEILLAYLCQLDRRSIESDLPLPGAQELVDAVFRVRADDQAACASHGRNCVEQRAGEYPDALHALSRVLASHAQEAWSSYCRTNAAPMRLLEHGVPARVGKLRAYGNAIVPQVAAEVIGAYLDATASGGA